MRLLNREGVGLGSQEVAALTEHQRLQVEFNGVTVHEDESGKRRIR